MAGGGTVFRSADGSLYFIRDEILSSCKVEGEYVDKLNELLAQSTGEVEGFSFEVQSGEVDGAVGYVQGDILSKGDEAMSIGPSHFPTSTIMCPW